ncbi:Substance-K receptor [Kappamyces sp. JEL0829]|nr:Substance-K receptor [Kappamyces sp. JEL0829]
MATIEQLQSDASFLQYSELDKIISGSFTSLALVGVIFASIVITALVRQGSWTPASLLILSLCIADLLVTTQQVLYHSVNLSFGRWYFSTTGCVIENIITVASTGTSLMTLAIITAERYLAIFSNYMISITQAKVIIVMIWTISFMMGSMPVIFRSEIAGIALHPSKLVCVVAWWSPIPIIKAIAIFSFSITFLSVITLGLVYTHIVYFYISHKKNKRFQSKERTLIAKSIALTVTFTICWGPYFCMCLYEIVSGKPVSSVIDTICSVLAVFNSTANPILLYQFDARVKNDVQQFSSAVKLLKLGKSQENIVPHPIQLQEMNELSQSKTTGKTSTDKTSTAITDTVTASLAQ